MSGGGTGSLDWVAVYAAAVATAALVWQIVEWIYSILSHVRVYGEVTVAAVAAGQSTFDVIGVTIINTGNHSVRVRSIVIQDARWFRRPPKWRQQMYRFMSGTDVDVEIPPHDSITSAFEIEQFRRLAGTGRARVAVQLSTERWLRSRSFRPADRARQDGSLPPPD